MKPSTATRILGSWKVIGPFAAIAIIAAGAYTYLANVAEIRSQIESAFISRARLTERFMAMNLGQVAVMRNRLQTDYQENRAGRDFTVINHPDLGIWSAASTLGNFSGDLAKPVDAEIRRQMHAAEGMIAPLSAALELNKEAAWMYFISAQDFVFLAPDAPLESARFHRVFYERPYWRQVIPEANPQRRTILAGPFLDMWGKGLRLTIAAPAYSGDQFLGITAIDLETDSLSKLLMLGDAVGETRLISENEHVIAGPGSGSEDKIKRPPLSARLPQWDDDSEGNFWLSGEIVKSEMWIVHKVSKSQIYWAAAKESLNVWLLLTILSILGVLGQRLVGLLRQLSQQTFHDALTGLPNRRLLADRLDQEIARAAREERRSSLLFIDLDKFKPVNDQHGHAVGDWLLKQVAERMRACMRQYDTVARIGGDEFVILLPNVKDNETAVTVAEKVRRELLVPFVRDDGTKLEISSSIGVAFFPDHADSASELLRFGDEAMYQAKESGRNTVVVFSPQADNRPLL